MKNNLHVLKTGAVALGLMSTVAAVSVEAARLADGRTLFDRPPNLVEATTLDHNAEERGRYHFVIEVPTDAGEPLGAVVITPRDRATDISFDFDASEAQLATAYARGPKVDLSSVGGAPNNPDEALVVFDQPVQPGNTVTVTLQTNRNPRGGVYLFGVTAYPDGENSVGQFIGYGRLHIYDVDN